MRSREPSCSRWNLDLPIKPILIEKGNTLYIVLKESTNTLAGNLQE